LPFAYYDDLSKRDQAIYRKSDAIHEVPLARAAALAPLAESIGTALGADDRDAVERASGELVDAIAAQLEVQPPRVVVLDVRPSSDDAELHGLYTEADDGVDEIRVWMRTRAHQRVVAYRTFLRTLLHELCHHLDYVFFGLADSFHTEGFFRRESHLVRQLAGPGRRRAVAPSPRS
jgi:hypothetical protein